MDESFKLKLNYKNIAHQRISSIPYSQNDSKNDSQKKYLNTYNDYYPQENKRIFNNSNYKTQSQNNLLQTHSHKNIKPKYNHQFLDDQKKYLEN